MRLFSPVLTKELIALSRRRRYSLLRGLILLVFLGFVIGAWSGEPGIPFAGDADNLAELGQVLFLVYTFAQFGTVFLAIPILTATVIAGERERDTLSLLLMSNLGRVDILLAKFTSRFLLLGLLLVSGMPLLLCILSFGGVTGKDIATSHLLLLSAVLAASGAGLFFSALFDTVISALIQTIVVVLLWAIVPLLLGLLRQGNYLYDVSFRFHSITAFMIWAWAVTVSPLGFLYILKYAHSSEVIWFGALFVLISWILLLRRFIRRFDRIVGRAGAR